MINEINPIPTHNSREPYTVADPVSYIPASVTLPANAIVIHDPDLNTHYVDVSTKSFDGMLHTFRDYRAILNNLLYTQGKRFPIRCENRKEAIEVRETIRSAIDREMRNNIDFIIYDPLRACLDSQFIMHTFNKANLALAAQEYT